MTKYIEVKLTEDQATAVYTALEEKYWAEDTPEEEQGFLARVLTKLAKAKTV